MLFALLGILPMPWVLCGEVFPMEVKGNNNRDKLNIVSII